MDLSKLSVVLATEPKYRYQQINQALWHDFISSWGEVSNLPLVLRKKLEEDCPLEIKADLISSSFGAHSEKALIHLVDGETIETVLIKQKGVPDNSGQRSLRHTICLSTQVGCPLACTFCATGATGFSRNLKAEEIIEQAVFWARRLRAAGRGDKLDNLVFMGMGEPFLNYAEFIKAAKFFNNPETFNLGARRLSVSTVGITEGIKRLAGEQLQFNLAVSLHAPSDILRKNLMPAVSKYSLREIFKAVDHYIVKTGRRVMFEYLMIKNVNDSDEEAEALALLLKKPLYFVNLIPYNSTGRFRPSDRERIKSFQEILNNRGVAATIRLSFGSDIEAACGQLKAGRKAQSRLKK